MRKSYEIHVISNTHWDREWLYNFQETRMMLVEFLDKLLDVLDKELMNVLATSEMLMNKQIYSDSFLKAYAAANRG